MQIVLACVLLAVGQTPFEWERVAALKPGSEIRVEFDAGVVTGTFSGISAGVLSLRVGGDLESIEFRRIKTLARRGPSRRGRHAAIGFMVGMVAGYVVWLKTCETCIAEGAAPFTAPLSAAGAATGAMLPPNRGWQLIYQRGVSR